MKDNQNYPTKLFSDTEMFDVLNCKMLGNFDKLIKIGKERKNKNLFIVYHFNKLLNDKKYTRIKNHTQQQQAPPHLELLSYTAQDADSVSTQRVTQHADQKRNPL